jgi:hypothetical protein
MMETTEAARKWLYQNPDAVLLVDEASAHIRTIFGDNHELSLEDFNYTGAFRSRRYYLVIKVRPHGPHDMLPLDLLHKLDKEWWLDNLHRAGGRLSITVHAQEDD